MDKTQNESISLKGNPVSRGIAAGRVFWYEPFVPDIKECHIEAAGTEAALRKYEEAVAAARKDLQDVYESLKEEDEHRAGIFLAHMEILEDEMLDEEIRSAIGESLSEPGWAAERVYSNYAKLLGEMEDELIRERAADIMDVKNRLLRCFQGVPQRNLSRLPGAVIVAAHDLLPSDTATIDRENVLAIVTEAGGATSHSAILAKGFGIPALLGIKGLKDALGREEAATAACEVPGEMRAATAVGNVLDEAGAGVAVVDALDGVLIVNPDKDTREHYFKRLGKWEEEQRLTREFLRREPLTKDGVRIEIGQNIGSAAREALAASGYTDFVGLFRTEFLFMEKESMPTEEEQFVAYCKVLKAYGGRPVTVRTLDIGGDKTLPYLEQEKEENPFLGNRALRLCFENPCLFKTQLRALYRASVHGKLQIMLPMVGGMDDILRAKQIIGDVKNELAAEGIAISQDVKVGIMIEIPSIALLADVVAKEVDFASIGTNDLCQYLLAADRMNPAVASYYQSYHPALYRLIGYVADEFQKAGKPLCVCGELGGDRLTVPVLVGLGLRKLSMGGSSVCEVKRVLSKMTVARMEELAAKVKACKTDQEVRDLCEKYMENTLGND